MSFLKGIFETHILYRSFFRSAICETFTNVLHIFYAFYHCRSTKSKPSCSIYIFCVTIGFFFLITFFFTMIYFSVFKNIEIVFQKIAESIVIKKNIIIIFYNYTTKFICLDISIFQHWTSLFKSRNN